MGTDIQRPRYSVRASPKTGLAFLLALSTGLVGRPGEGCALLPAPPDSARSMLDPRLEPLRLADAPRSTPFDPGRAPFILRVRGDTVPVSVFFLSAMPGESLHLERDPKGPTMTLRYSSGRILAATEAGWIWEAPPVPGVHPLRIGSDGTGESVFLNVFVLHVADQIRGGVLNGYRIGAYNSAPLRSDSIYLPPPGFIEVVPENEDILVSPHFTIGQFLCKQPGNPRYLALSRYLVAKLEAIVEAANAEGYPMPTLHVMSGFRTPWYNQFIGNQTSFSRHLWGGAADIYPDVDGDGMMDDLNGDGHSTIADAQILLDIARKVDASGVTGSRAGGLSAYRRNSARGPFIHVDARGRAASW